MIGAADLKVKRGNSIVGCRDVGVEVGLGDVLGESLSFLFQPSVIVTYRLSHGSILKTHRGL